MESTSKRNARDQKLPYFLMENIKKKKKANQKQDKITLYELWKNNQRSTAALKHPIKEMPLRGNEEVMVWMVLPALSTLSGGLGLEDTAVPSSSLEREGTEQICKVVPLWDLLEGLASVST